MTDKQSSQSPTPVIRAPVVTPTDSQSSTSSNAPKSTTPTDTTTVPPSGSSGTNENTDTDSQIDNPYLREIKMPRLKGAGKKSTSIQAMSSSTKWSF